MFGKEKANKIILSPNSILSSDIKPLLQILYYFNADFRKALSRNFPFLKNIWSVYILFQLICQCLNRD